MERRGKKKKGEMTEKPRSSPSLPWTTKLFGYFIIVAANAARRDNGTVNRRLLKLLVPRTRAHGKPVKGVKTFDVTVDRTRNVWFRVFTPTETVNDGNGGNGLPVIVYFHGGGFVVLSPDTREYDAMCRRIARKIPAIIVSVHCRQCPEYRSPAPYDDGVDVIRFLDKSNGLIPGADWARCFLAGDSSGGNVAHHVARMISEIPKSEFRAIKMIGLVLLQPFLGGQERTPAELRLVRVPLYSLSLADWVWKVFLPEGSDRDHEVANVSGGPRSVDISGLDFPATLIFVAGFDPLQDWQKRYFEWLKKSGFEAYLVEYPRTIHGFYVFPKLPESSMVITEIRKFIEKQSSKVKNVEQNC
ncbi:putative carboxylesterase 18 [Tasmannia lanceolata]|uniref:putative carboxylesterase 18 n=1 Tax=Tasmannia lanceolata TaxID=3420 RepID=UPI004062C03A